MHGILQGIALYKFCFRYLRVCLRVVGHNIKPISYCGS